MKAKVKVLIAEDSVQTRLILKDMLLRSGCEVAGEAKNGDEAVEMYEELKPDVVLIDIAMPKTNGIEALKKIKAAHPPAKAVMLSAMGQQDQVIEAMRAGAADFVIKPVRAEGLAAALENALK